MHCQKCHISVTWKNPGYLMFWTEVCGTLGQGSKTHKTGAVWGEPGRMGSLYVCVEGRHCPLSDLVNNVNELVSAASDAESSSHHIPVHKGVN
jgi:hypothetical protein